MELRDDWRPLAICTPSDFDGTYQQQYVADRVCPKCPVQVECLVDSLDNHRRASGSGAWGGLTEYERRAALAAYPEVRSWRTLFLQTKDFSTAFSMLKGARRARLPHKTESGSA